MNKPMTAREFVLHEDHCPNCGAKVLDGNSITIDGPSAYQEAHCAECGIGFNTIYRLVGYILDGGEPQTIAEDFGGITASGDNTPEHSDFREALLRAYVQGWHAKDASNDDGKHKAAAEIEKEFPQLAQAARLLP